MRDKSAEESKSRNLMDKLSATEAKKEELGCLVAAEKEDADKAYTEARAARADAKLACAEASLALQRAAEAEASHRSLQLSGQGRGLYPHRGQTGACVARGRVPTAWCSYDPL
jgi:hypothetical protein